MRSILNFAKQVLAATLGIAIFSFFCFFLVFSILFSSNIARPPQQITEVVKENTILRFKLKGRVVQHSQDPRRKKVISIAEIDAVLEQAAQEPKIQGIFIRIDDIYAQLDDLEALRQVFQKFKTATGHPIVVYSSEYNDALLAFASVADIRILHPSGDAELKGFSSTQLFFKRLLDRYNLAPIFIQAGKYKVESMPYVNEKMTDHDKKQWLEILHEMHDDIKKNILRNKNITLEKINNLLASTTENVANEANTIQDDNTTGQILKQPANHDKDENPRKKGLDRLINTKPIYTPEEAKKLGLIDIIGFEEEADKCFNHYFSHGTLTPNSEEGSPTEEPATETSTPEGENATEEEEDPAYYVSYKGYLRSLAPFFMRKNQKQASKVGILPLAGDIVSKTNDDQSISENKVLPMLESYEEDDDIKAIVIIMDSPGGGVIPTANISRVIERIKKKKPVVCLVRNSAFSGGLHIAVACDKVLASSNGTGIGSIGVWSMFFNFKEAAEKHAYITSDGVKTHEHADLWSQFADDDKKQKFLKPAMQYYYKAFKEHVKKHRGLTDQEMQNAAEGIVYTAKKAIDLKIIDGIASQEGKTDLQCAIDLALELANIDKEQEEILIVYPIRQISIQSYLAYFIRSIFRNNQNDLSLLIQSIFGSQNPLKIHKKGKKMYHLGYHLQQEGQAT